MKYIKVIGVTNPSRFEDYIASDLVDIIFSREFIGNTATLSVESDINLDNEEDRKWIIELINEGLLECQEILAKIFIE